MIFAGRVLRKPLPIWSSSDSLKLPNAKRIMSNDSLGEDSQIMCSIN